MRRTALFGYLSVPALLAVGVFVIALRHEPLRIEMFARYVLGGYFFYAAPQLLWVVVAALGRFSNAVWHAGFIAASTALGAIAIFWLFPRDPSGLPIQWLLYWPLAIVLQILIAGAVGLYRRVRAPNSGMQPTPTSGAADAGR
jgi:hypothetical protein